jgi:hypothetical protein
VSLYLKSAVLTDLFEPGAGDQHSLLVCCESFPGDQESLLSSLSLALEISTRY